MSTENSGSRQVDDDRAPNDGRHASGHGTAHPRHRDTVATERGATDRVVTEGVVTEGVVTEGVVPQNRVEATARQKERYGGVKVGSAFFGWLTATGTAVLLTALVVAAGAAVGVSTGTTVQTATTEATQGTATAQTVGLVGGIALLVVLFLAYYCGGYVAGRMARFNGLKQGLAVWLWAVFIAIVVAVVAAVAGSRYDVLNNLNAFPRIPTSGTLTTGGLIALAAVAVASLVGALLGGLAGMRFHRKVDQAAFEPAHT